MAIIGEGGSCRQRPVSIAEARGDADNAAVRLAKQHVDVGLFTNNAEAMLAFWRDEIGLRYDEMLALGGGVQQHRFDMHGSVLKVTAVRDPMPSAPPCGYRELLIAREGNDAPRTLADPDGNRVTLVPPGGDSVAGIGVRMAVRDRAAADRFFA